MVVLKRAAHATLAPAGAKHKMPDDQLAAPGEQIGKRLAAVRSIEDIALVHLDPRQRPSFGGQPVAQAGEFLFLGQQFLAENEPVVSRYDPVLHRRSPSQRFARLRGLRGNRQGARRCCSSRSRASRARQRSRRPPGAGSALSLCHARRRSLSPPFRDRACRPHPPRQR